MKKSTQRGLEKYRKFKIHTMSRFLTKLHVSWLKWLQIPNRISIAIDSHTTLIESYNVWNLNRTADAIQIAIESNSDFILHITARGIRRIVKQRSYMKVIGSRSRHYNYPGAQPRLKSWGGPRFRSQHWGACSRRPAKGRAGCWVREGVARSLLLFGSGVSPPGITPGFFFENSDAKSCILVTILAVKFLAFWKLRPKSWGTNTLLVPQPYSWETMQSPPIHGCCAYATIPECKTSIGANSVLCLI